MDVNQIIDTTFKKEEKKRSTINNSFPFKKGKIYKFYKWRAQKYFGRDSIIVSFKNGEYHLPQRNANSILAYYSTNDRLEEKKLLFGRGIKHSPNGKLLFKKFKKLDDGRKAAVWIPPSHYNGSTMEESSCESSSSSDDDDDNKDDHEEEEEGSDDDEGEGKLKSKAISLDTEE